MATVTLGNIKLNWKGAYNAGTAYAIDDVVSYNGSSYVAKTATTGNLPTVTANWDIMSQAGTNGTNGTNGTDVGTVITTQGDMLYRDGSGLQRLAKGTANQELRINSGATAPEWFTPATVTSDIVKVATTTISGSPASIDFKFSTLSGGTLDFTTYRKFELQFEDVSHDHSSNYSHLYFRFLGSDGNTIASSYYNWSNISQQQSNGTVYKYESENDSNVRITRDYQGAQAERGTQGNFTIYNTCANNTTYPRAMWDLLVTNHDSNMVHDRVMGHVCYESESAVYGVRFYQQQGNFRNGGKIITIGYK